MYHTNEPSPENAQTTAVRLARLRRWFCRAAQFGPWFSALLVLANPREAPAASGSTRNLLAHWELATDCRDSSGKGNHGTNHGAEFRRHEDRPAARFDGRRSWIEVSASDSLRLGTSNFTVAAWVNLPDEAGLDDAFGDIISRFDPGTRRGFVFGITHRAGVTTSQPNTRNVHFGMDDGQAEARWTDHGRPGNAILIFALAVHDGQLYAGTCEPGRDQAGHVFQFRGATNWTDCGSPDRCNSVSALAVFGDRLYAGVSKYRLAGSSLPESENPHLGGSVYRHAGGRSWEFCGQLPDTEAIGGLVVFRGRLYASSLYRPAGFFRYEGGQRWTALPTPAGKRVEAMCVYDGQLFASTYDEGHVFRYDGTNWTDSGQVGPRENTQTYSFAVHEGRLHVGTWSTGRVFRHRADNNWEDMGRLGEELEVMGMIVHNGKLYAGSLPSAEVYRFDAPGNWTRLTCLDATPNVKYRRAWTMAEFQGRLFCGTLPSGRVFSFEAGRNVTCDRALPPGWHHVAAVRHENRLELFVDGKSVAVSAEFDPAQFDLSLDQPLKIGFGPNDFFRGRLRDLRLYGTALSVREIASLAR